MQRNGNQNIFTHPDGSKKRTMSNLQKENRIELKQGLIIASKLVGVCLLKHPKTFVLFIALLKAIKQQKNHLTIYKVNESKQRKRHMPKCMNSHRCAHTHIYTYLLSLLSLPLLPSSHSSESSQSSRLDSLCYIAASCQLSVLHRTMYTCQGYGFSCGHVWM